MNPVNQPKTKKGQETLDRIICEARDQFSSKGYYKTSIKDITTAADIGVGTFYIYFDDKRSLYQTILNDYGHYIRRHIAKSVGPTKNRKEAERMGVKVFIEMVRKNPSMYNIIWEALYVDKKLFVDYYTSFAESYIKQIEKAQTKDEIHSELDPEILAYLLMGTTNFIGLRYAIFDDQDDLDEILDNLMNVFEKGFLK